ncbi:sulfurtransferase TusA family protein [Treponema denticola]|uniref:sulfurtransferase TusA family protein n=1 Tax=Treponema denticola TaxID=158 RepID=UPI0002B55F49|nr:sulfurtransferase TusA family protein [Treponema denticola]EMB44041.1 hypothetical protein HMPREF9730_01981 [Treponema denticola AL-2]UTY26664.1 hypothetical protein E4N77_08330 [Treponema denticola]
MSDIIVDARGLACPEPVVLTKKALAVNSAFVVLVDNETSKENIKRFCDNAKAKTKIEPSDDGWKIAVAK